MAEEQPKDPTLELVYQWVTAGEKPKTLAIAKIKSKAVRKYLLQFKRLTTKKGVLHWFFINNDAEYHQMVLTMKTQIQVLQIVAWWPRLSGDWKNYCLMLVAILSEYHVPRCYQICKSCPQCQTVKGNYSDPDTMPDVTIGNNPMDLVCVNCTKVDPLKNGKENILVLTDGFTKFSQAFVTPNQKAITIAKILVDKVLCVWYSCMYTQW